MEGKADNTLEIILLATIKYNRSILSVTERRPIDIVHPALPRLEEEIRGRIEKDQQAHLGRNNPSRQNRVFEVGEMVMVKNNRRLG